jgi:hypothetical protein
MVSAGGEICDGGLGVGGVRTNGLNWLLPAQLAKTSFPISFILFSFYFFEFKF